MGTERRAEKQGEAKWFSVAGWHVRQYSLAESGAEKQLYGCLRALPVAEIYWQIIYCWLAHRVLVMLTFIEFMLTLLMPIRVRDLQNLCMAC